MDNTQSDGLNRDRMQSISILSDKSFNPDSPSRLDSRMINVQENARPDSLLNRLIYKPPRNYKRWAYFWFERFDI